MTQKKAESSSTRLTQPAHPQQMAWAWIIAAAGDAIEALALLGLAVAAVYSVFTGGASTTTRALTEAVSLAVLGIGVALLSVHLLRRKALAKTPTLLWNGILFLLSFSLMKGGAPLAGAVTLVVSAVTFIAALVLPRFELDDELS